MAERRMFAKTIIDSDAFLDMPLSSQCLYFHLSMRADDDGFINNPKKIQRMIGASDDDLKLLIAKNFIIPFETGIVVIKHWKIHNYIQKDRYKETVYKEEKAQLHVKKNNAYTLDDSGIQNGYIPDTQVRLVKDSKEIELEKDINKKKTGSAAYEEIISESITHENVKEAVREFIKMRKLIKSPMTEHALKLMINKLQGMSGDPAMQIAILNQSIENSWKGIFPLREETAKKNKTAQQLDQSYEMMSAWAESEE